MSDSKADADQKALWSRWEEVDRLFEQALDLPPDRRRPFLDEACADDRELRASLTALLELDEEGETLTGPGDALLRAAFDQVPRADENREALVGTRVGPYLLTGVLGAGGMGTVYRAERADGAFEREVAIKVLRPSILLDNPDALERFRTERQILASLSHPSIAQMMDGGVTEDGRPFLVMEAVDGIPIDLHAQRHGLDVDARVDLVLRVAEAIEFAHRHMVVHRDIKPSNILVTQDGGVKLLDFGVAKLLDPAGTAGGQTATATTRLGARFMTPEWAAPEQLLGERVNTQTDVYALAALLYYLLTGQRPYAARGDESVLQRVVRGDEPTAPSAVIVAPPPGADPGLGEGLPDTGLTRAELRRRLDGDLDAILLRGLRSRPDERYGSVVAFREDLERHRSGRAVVARGDAFLYRARKFARRNRVPLSAAAGAFLLAAGSAVGLAWQRAAVVEERNRAEEAAAAANRDAETARQVTAFLVDLFQANEPQAGVEDTLSVQAILDRGRTRVNEELADQPAVRAGLLEAMARVYMNMGDGLNAEIMAERALALRRDTLPGDDGVVSATLLLGHTLRAVRDFPRSAATYREAAELAEATSNDSALAVAELGRGQALVFMDEPDSAEAALRRSVQIFTRIGADSDKPFLDAANALAGSLRRRGDFDGAESLYRRVLEQRRALGDEQLIATALNNLAVVLRMKEEYDEAVSLYREGVRIVSTQLGPGHPTSLMYAGNLATALARGGRNEDAIAVYRDRLTAAREQWPDGHWRTGTTLMELGAMLLTDERPDEALIHLNEALEMMMVEIGPMHSWTDVYRGWVAVAAKAAGHEEDAARIFDDSFAGLSGYEGLAGDRQVLGMIEGLTRVLDQYGLTDEAARYRALARIEP